MYGDVMRITVDIDVNDLKEVMRDTGRKKKSSAISAAVGEYLRLRRIDRLMAKVREGKVDYGCTNDELEAMVEPEDAHH